MKKKFFFLFVIFNLLISTVSFAFPNAPTDFYYDEMNVLTTETKEHINKINLEIEEKTKAQIMVVTTNDLEGMEPSDYSLKLIRDWKIGDKKENNGAVILLAYNKENDKYNVDIRVGYGLEGALNDAKVGRIIDDYMLPYFNRDDKSSFDKGLKEGFNAVVTEVVKEYDIEINGDYTVEKPKEENISFSKIITMVIIIIVISSIFGGGGRNRPGGRSRRYYRGPFGGYGGGFGSSSGRSSGGGFSGGGGSSGGGGAGRSF